MIKKFNEFHSLNESVLYYAPPFREQLKNLKEKGSEIAKKLLELELEDLPTDITFINSSEVGYLTFHPMSKAIEKIEKIYGSEDDRSDIQSNPNRRNHDNIYKNEVNGFTHLSIYSGNKNAIKIGKFVKKILPTISDIQIEDFVNELKATQDDLKERLELVSGEDIAKWYKSENCYNSGTLGSSCMVDKDYFELYTKNPESVNLLIMKSGEKIVARALVWKIHKSDPELGFTYYMDKIYTNINYQEKVMIDFAEKHGWAYRKPGNCYEREVVYQGKENDVKMSVKIKKIKYKRYPYMDTFSRYDYAIGLLWNDMTRNKKTRGHILQSTQGEFREGTPRGLIRRWGDYFGLDIPPLNFHN
jgi:hypothetical protein